MGNTEAKPEEDVQERPPGIVLQSYQASETQKHADVAIKVENNSKSPDNPGPIEETKRRESSFFKMFSGKEDDDKPKREDVPGEAVKPDGSTPVAGQHKDAGGAFSLKHIFSAKDSQLPAADEERAGGGGGGAVEKAQSAVNGPVTKTALPTVRGKSAEKPPAAQPAPETKTNGGQETAVDGSSQDGFFGFLKKKGAPDVSNGAAGLSRLQSVNLQDSVDEAHPSEHGSLPDSQTSSTGIGGFFRSMGGKKLVTVGTQTEPVQVLPIKENGFSFKKK